LSYHWSESRKLSQRRHNSPPTSNRKTLLSSRIFLFSLNSIRCSVVLGLTLAWHISSPYYRLKCIEMGKASKGLAVQITMLIPILFTLAAGVLSVHGRSPLIRRSDPKDEKYCCPRNYGRAIKTVPNDCADDKDKDGALCYPKCRDGYRGIGPVCWERCRHGYIDDGLTCRRDTT
jgi:hypothetical protein